MISSICACFWFSLAAVVVVPYIAGRPRLLHQSKNFLRLGMFLLFSSFFWLVFEWSETVWFCCGRCRRTINQFPLQPAALHSNRLKWQCHHIRVWHV